MTTTNNLTSIINLGGYLRGLGRAEGVYLKVMWKGIRIS